MLSLDRHPHWATLNRVPVAVLGLGFFPDQPLAAVWRSRDGSLLPLPMRYCTPRHPVRAAEPCLTCSPATRPVSPATWYSSPIWRPSWPKPG